MTDAAAFLAGPPERSLAKGRSSRLSKNGETGKTDPVFVDFDHTLFGGNSTELFLASCRPSLLVAIIEFVVRRCLPWRLTGLTGYFRLRDFVCCTAVMILCPWSLAMWRRRAPQVFERAVSQEIAQRLSESRLSASSSSPSGWQRS